MPPYEKPKTSYDFITTPPTPQKNPLAFGRKLPLIAGGGVLLVILILIVVSLFNRGPSNTENLLTTAQDQTEIVRIAKLGTKDAAQTTMNVAVNTGVSVETDRLALLKTLNSYKVSFKTKELAKGANPQTDKALQTARAASNFDETFLKTLDTKLSEYQTALQAAHKKSDNQALKKNLSSAYDHAASLRKQITAVQ